MEKENRKSIIELANAMAEAEFQRDNPSGRTQWKNISSFSKKMKIQNYLIHARIALEFAVLKFEKGINAGFQIGYRIGNMDGINGIKNNNPTDDLFYHYTMIENDLLPCNHSDMLPELCSIDGDYGERCHTCQKTDKEIMDEEKYCEREEIPYFCEKCSNVLTTVCITLDNKFVCTNCFKN